MSKCTLITGHAAHTPGPWHCEDSSGRPPIQTEIIAGIRHIADVRLYEDCDFANAMLIACAPEMAEELVTLRAAKTELLELCQEILKSDEDSVTALTKAGFIKSEKDLQESSVHMAKLRALIAKHQ